VRNGLVRGEAIADETLNRTRLAKRLDLLAKETDAVKQAEIAEIERREWWRERKPKVTATSSMQQSSVAAETERAIVLARSQGFHDLANQLSRELVARPPVGYKPPATESADEPKPPAGYDAPSDDHAEKEPQ